MRQFFPFFFKAASVSQFDPMKTDTNSQLPDFSAGTDDPGLMERARRFSSVVYLAARIYAGYKSTQVWTRYVSAARKVELYRRQDLRSARALYHTAISLEGLLIKAS